MARQKRYNRKKDLLNVPVLIEETGITSKYFQIYDVPEELPMGKSSFLIGGSQLLVPQIKLQIEIIDSQGGVIYTQPVFGYTEGTSKRIAIEVYEDTPPGRCQLVVLGEIDPSKVDFNIPAEFRGKYNLRYTRDLSVNLTIPNTLPIRFYRTPKATVEANSKGVIELDVKPTETVTLTGTGRPKSHVNQEVPITNIDGSITYPGIDSRTKNIRAVIEQNKASAKEGGGGNFLPIPPTQQDPPGDYTLTLSSTQKADVSMIGQDVLISSPSVDYGNSAISSEESYLYSVPSAFSSSVLDVTDENTLTLLDSFYVTKKGEEPPTKIPAALESVSISATRQPEATGSESVFNFYDVADILLTDLRNFSGDVNKVRIYTRSDAAQNPSQWNFIKEIFLEAKEELYDTGSLLRSGNMGYFITQNKIDDHWQGYSGEFGGTSGGAISLTRDNSKIMNAMDISGSNRTYQHDLLVQSTKPMSLQKNVRYEVSMKVYGDAKSKLKGTTTDTTKGKFQIFISGSGIPANTDLPSNYGRLLGNLELPSDESNGQGSYNFDLVEASYISKVENNAYLQLRMPSGRWKVAEISVKPSTSTNFSPEVFKCFAELPVAQQRPDFYQFLVEFYDVNNNKADTTAISERIKFDGANLTIQGEDNLLSGSMFIGNTLLSGIEAGGGNSAFIRSLGYFGFDKAESLASGGFMFWSGSVIPDHETYDGVGLELHNDETSGSGNDSYLQFRTKDKNGNSKFRVRTNEFFFGNEGQHISGSGGNIQISSSKFYLGSDTQFVSGADGNIEISSSNFHLTSTGDVTMSGTITAEAGYIAGWQIVGDTLSGSNVTLDAAGAGLYKSDAGPDSYPTNGYYIDFTPGTNYYIRMGPHFAVSSSGVLIASGAVIEGQLTSSTGLIANWNIGNDAIYKYTTSNTWTGLSSTGPTRFFAGATTLAASSSAPFNVKESGEVTASSGLIGGWSLSSNKLVSPNSRMTMSANPGNERITVRKSATSGSAEVVRIGEISDAAGDLYGIKIYDGTGVYNDDTKQGQVVLLGEQGNMIGGWEITDTQIRTIPDAGFGGQFAEGESGLVIHSSGRLESADFASNLKGWRIDSLGNGTAEFENARIRGTLSTAVFEKESVNVVGGQLMVANSSALGALKSGSIIIAGAETASASDVTMSMDNVSGFAAGEIIKAKVVGDTGFSVEYLYVTGSQRFSHPSSSVSASLASYDMGAIDPDGTAGEIYVGRAYGGTPAISSSVSTITEPMTQSSTSGSTERITVASSASFSDQEIIKIDDERMKIVSADGLNTPSGSGTANTMVVLRDYNDTENVAHADNSAVWRIDTDKEFLAGLVSTAQPYNAGQVFVSTGKYDSDKRSSGYILMNANPNDMSTPYMDIVERTGSGVYDLSLKTRVGDLSGLSSAYLYGDEEPGFGIYTENGFFSGAITAQTGSFAGVVHVATVQGGLETGEKISIGRQVSGQNDGIYINNNNYWYTTGAWKVGGATNYLSLDNATDGNITIASDTFTLEAGNLDINSAQETIRLGSTTTFGSGTGVLMGKDGSDYEFYAGNGTQYLHWDGSNLTIAGTINVVNSGDFATPAAVSGSFDASGSGASALEDGKTYSQGVGSGAQASASAAEDAATSAGQAAAAATELSASNNTSTQVSASLSYAADRRFNDELGKLDKAAAPAGSGLFLGSQYLGYYNGSSWMTYMANTGDFFLQGTTANRGLVWDASQDLLSISGSITALDGYIGGESQGWSINSGYITSVGGTKTITLDGQNAKIFIGTGTYNNSNTPVYMDGASQFSLGSKLTWDGSALSIDGEITATTGTIGGFHIGATDLWGGNATIGNAATKIVLGDISDGGTPKIGLGATADNISATTGTGFYVDGDGNFRVGESTSGDNYIYFNGNTVDFKSTSFNLVAGTGDNQTVINSDDEIIAFRYSPIGGGEKRKSVELSTSSSFAIVNDIEDTSDGFWKDNQDADNSFDYDNRESTGVLVGCVNRDDAIQNISEKSFYISMNASSNVEGYENRSDFTTYFNQTDVSDFSTTQTKVTLDFAAVGSGSSAVHNLLIDGMFIEVEAYDDSDNIIGNVIKKGTKNRAGSPITTNFIFISSIGTSSYPEAITGIGVMPTVTRMYFKVTMRWSTLASMVSPGSTLNVLCDKVRIDKYAPKTLMNRMGFEHYSTPSSYLRLGGDIMTIRGDVFMAASQSFTSDLGVTGNVGINDPSGSTGKYNLWVGTGYSSGSSAGIGTSQGISAKEYYFYDSFEPVNDGASTGKPGDSSGSKIYHKAGQGITFDTQLIDLIGLGTTSQMAAYINQSGFYAVGNVTAYASDLRLKENIEIIPNSLEKIKKISGVTFDWKDGVRKMGFVPSDNHEHGMIAQEVEEVLPDAIAPAPFNSKYKTIRHEKVIPLLVEGIKEQQNQIDDLKKQLNTIVCGSLEPQ